MHYLSFMLLCCTLQEVRNDEGGDGNNERKEACATCASIIYVDWP